MELFTDNVRRWEIGNFLSSILDKPVVTTSDLTVLIFLLQNSIDNLTILQMRFTLYVRRSPEQSGRSLSLKSW